MDKNTTIEIWKDIVGYEGYYKVSNLGRIKSLDWITRHNYGGEKKKSGCVIKPINQNNGYLTVNLSVRGKRKCVLIHILVATSFIQNPENKPCVNHKDGDKKNNNLINLEWVTYSENSIHSYRVLNKISSRRKPVMQLCLLTSRVINTFSSSMEAASVLKVSNKNISAVLNNRSKSCGGYGWTFA